MILFQLLNRLQQCRRFYYVQRSVRKSKNIPLSTPIPLDGIRKRDCRGRRRTINRKHSYEQGYPFRKMRCILFVGKFPNPSCFPLTTYNTAQGDFAEVLRGIFQKVFLVSYYGKVSKMPNKSERKIHDPEIRLRISKSIYILFLAIIRTSAYNYIIEILKGRERRC